MTALILAVSQSVSTATAQTDDDEDWADAVLALIAGIDFESYAIGPLGSPWTVTPSGASTMTVESLVALAGSGKALKINGGNTVDTDYVVGNYPFADTSADIWVDFQVYTVGPGNEWGFRLWQNYLGSPFVETAISMDSGNLNAVTWTGADFEWVSCAAFSASAWHRVTVNLDFDTGFYDVYLDNTLVCNDFYQIWGDQTPYADIDFLDWSDANFGGVTWIDNIYIGTTPPPVPTTTTTTTTTTTSSSSPTTTTTTAGSTTTTTAGTTTTTTSGSTTTTTAGATTTVTTTSTTTTTGGGDDDTADDDTTDDDTDDDADDDTDDDADDDADDDGDDDTWFPDDDADDDADDDTDDDSDWPGGDDDTADTGGGGDDDDDGGCGCGC
ncbi:MAG: hypothetical protein IT350_21225 [Deltaproteobacteria bacterium]|nr:hypothetical protein [Deltaproteobacteria bacterium]